MPDIWMDVDAAVTVPVNIMPLIAVADFKTVLASETYNEAGLDLIWNFVTTAGVQSHTAITPTDTGGSYDWVNVGHGMYNIELPDSVNNTEGFGWFTGVATDALPWRGPTIGFRAAGLNNALIDSAWSATRGLAGTALPDAAADAAGGLAISDAGGLALDAILADTAELQTDWVNGGRLDLILDIIASDTTTDIPALIGTAQGNITSILADTGELQTDWVNGGRLDLILDIIAADTTTDIPALIADVPTVAEFEARTLVAADYVVVGDTLAAVTTVGSVTGAVGSVTGAVGSVAANGITATSIAADAINAAAVKADAVTKIQSGLATSAALTVIDDFLDTEVAAILADTNELQTDWVNGGRLDSILDIIAADTTTDIPALINDLPTNAELATALGTADDAVLTELAKVPKSDSNVTWNATALASINAEVDTALNTAIPGSPTADSVNERIATMDTSIALMRLLIATGTVVDDNDPDPTATAFETNLAEASNDHYNGAFLVFTSGALLDQSRKIAGYVGATKVITTSAFTEAPAGGDTFAILGRSE